MKPASHRQRLRLTTLALTRDVTSGRRITLRADRKVVLAKVLDSRRLSEERAARIIAKWEAADEIPLAWEKTLDYQRAYARQRKILPWTLYKLSTV